MRGVARVRRSEQESTLPGRIECPATPWPVGPAWGAGRRREVCPAPVSYTHLTLPTICSV
eukprot:8300973-Lingulodinium_polyedra.AAC.1